MRKVLTVRVLCVTVLVLVSMLSFQFGVAFADDWENIDTVDTNTVAGSNPGPPFAVSPQCGNILLIDNRGGSRAPLDAFGYTYTHLDRAFEIETESFSQYKVIYVAWDVDVHLLSALYDRRADLESWINAGGGIIVNGQRPGGLHSYDFLPAQFLSRRNCGENIEILAPAHPLANNLTGESLSNWNYSSHTTITTWPSTATVVARCAAHSSAPAPSGSVPYFLGAHILGMPYGCGKIIVTGTDPASHLGNSGPWQLIYNELSWACSPSCPAITSINPASSSPGQTLNVTITGVNLSGATAVSFGTGVTVNSFTVNSDTQVTASISTAVLGTWDVMVTTPCCSGTLTGGFTVNSPMIGTGSHSSSVSGATGTVSTTYGFTPPVVIPTVAVQSATLSAKIVAPGTPVTVTADIANKSAVNGNKKIVLYVNGQVEAAQGITVGSGGSSKLTFSVSRSEPGDYNVYVDGVPAGSFRVELFRESDSILIFSAALVALAFLIGVIMLWHRQKRTVS